MSFKNRIQKLEQNAHTCPTCRRPIDESSNSTAQELAQQMRADYLAKGKTPEEAAELAQIVTEAAYPGTPFDPTWMQ